jgi:hypothetical protein
MAIGKFINDTRVLDVYLTLQLGQVKFTSGILLRFQMVALKKFGILHLVSNLNGLREFGTYILGELIFGDDDLWLCE